MTTACVLLTSAVQAETLRDRVRDNVAERTAERLDTRPNTPAGPSAEARLETITQRLDTRDEVGAPRLRPDARLIRRGARLETRLSD